MLEDLFTRLTMAMGGGFGIALIAAVAWGVLSILLSPCHLSSIPLVIGYMSAQGAEGVKRPVLLSFVFSVGILVTIALLGAVTAAAGRMMGDVGVWGGVVVSGVFLVVGLYLLDIVPLRWKGMARSTAVRGWKGALLLGLIFGIGLGPCTFAFMAPVLGVAFGLATTDVVRAIALVAAFGLGHCAVIAGAGGAAGTVQRYLNWTGQSKGATVLRRGAGVLVICAGAYYLSTTFFP